MTKLSFLLVEGVSVVIMLLFRLYE